MTAETQAASLAYGVLATPQVYLFDQDRKLRYIGRIDDSDVKTVTSHDTRNALDALLAGKPVEDRQDAGFRLLNKVVGQARGRPQIAGKMGSGGSDAGQTR